MAQFTFYSSSDAGAPTLSGTAGSLLTVLDACLVNGYGAKSAAGWTKPIANSGNCGHYLQGAGSGFHLFINDNGPNATSTFGEAWATGWKTMSGIAAPVGAGSNQFPTPAQLLTSGHVVIKKTSAADSVARQWMVYADSRTVYLFTQYLVSNPNFFHFYFGDIYSLAGSADANRCIIAGRLLENSASTAYTADNVDAQLFSGGSGGWVISGANQRGIYTAGHPNGNTGSLMARLSSAWQYVPYGGSEANTPWGGVYTAPNAADLSIRLAPIRVHDAGYFNYRGRLRGLWAPAHPASTFQEGQIITGANETAGKTFRVVRGVSGSATFVETSDTVETN